MRRWHLPKRQPGTAQSQIANHQANENNTDPRRNPTNNFGIARAEYPAQICPRVVAKYANRLEAENPSRVKTDGQVQRPGPFEGVTQN